MLIWERGATKPLSTCPCASSIIPVMQEGAAEQNAVLGSRTCVRIASGPLTIASDVLLCFFIKFQPYFWVVQNCVNFISYRDMELTEKAWQGCRKWLFSAPQWRSSSKGTVTICSLGNYLQVLLFSGQFIVNHVSSTSRKQKEKHHITGIGYSWCHNLDIFNIFTLHF